MNTISNHTPGPWFVAAQDSKDDRLEIAGYAGCSIALVSKQDPQEDGGRSVLAEIANARLLAAVPKLLAIALKFVEGCQNGEVVGEKYFSALYDEAQSAISQAHGGYQSKAEGST